MVERERGLQRGRDRERGERERERYVGVGRERAVGWDGEREFELGLRCDPSTSSRTSHDQKNGGAGVSGDKTS